MEQNEPGDVARSLCIRQFTNVPSFKPVDYIDLVIMATSQYLKSMATEGDSKEWCQLLTAVMQVSVQVCVFRNIEVRRPFAKATSPAVFRPSSTYSARTWFCYKRIDRW